MDLPTKFWSKWLKADSLERLEIIEDLCKKGLYKSIMALDESSLNKKTRIHCLALMLNSYFEDLWSMITSE